MKKLFVLILIVTTLLTLSACTSMNRRQQTAGSGAIVGAGLGAVLGQAIGRNTEGTLLGAGAGAALGGIVGNEIGKYMDSQEQALRSAVAASESAQVRRVQDTLIATFKSDLLFDFNSAVLRPGAYSEIDRVAGILLRYPGTRIRVEGHTDNIGLEAYNQKLSEKRAQAVKFSLIQKGISANRIQAYGYGESQPLSTNHAMNRRVEIVIDPIEQSRPGLQHPTTNHNHHS